VGPRYQPPCAEVPSSWKNQQEEECEYEANRQGELFYLENWWEAFEDSKLSELENWAIENNRDLFVACERIQEARALMGIAASDFYPQITLNPLYTNTGELIKNYVSGAAASLIPGPRVFRAHELFYSLPFNMNYEVDLWGKILDQYQSAKYEWLSQKKNYEAVMLSLTASLATAYYQLRAADSQIDLLLAALGTRQKAFEINKDRYEGKITFYADVTLAGEEIDTVIVQYDEILRQRKTFENQIAVLLGVPASEFCLPHSPLVGLPPCIPAGIPSEILLRRPDIAAAELEVKSRHALLKRAYTQFFPSLSLTAVGGSESPEFKEFLTKKSRYWMLGASIDQLIFDGGAAIYNVKREKAILEEASGTYQKQVLIAFQEVEDALSNIASYAKQYEAQLAATNWAQKTWQLYLDRYNLGLTYYINVVDTERDLLNFQINLNAIAGFRFVSTIQLIQALGGGW
jgi:multidrug efflux system outer membrane protein